MEGSTLAARRAGTQIATAPVANNKRTTPNRATGDQGLNPSGNKSTNGRIANIASGAPTPAPHARTTTPSRSAVQTILRREAPSAARIPNSRVRRPTAYEMDPYNPISDSVSPRLLSEPRNPV